MPDTTPAIVDPSAPSELLTSVLFAVSAQTATATGMTMMMRRQDDFPSPLAAQLTGIALDPPARDYADDLLDTYWSNEGHRQYALGSAHPGREVIIGSGFHAAVYAAVRVLSGHPRPLVLERAQRAGGTFAITKRPTWNLNSRNRAGVGGLPRDRMASLNYLPGAPIQASNVSMADYQSNADMAFVIRLTLAQFADVVTAAPVQSVTPADVGLQIEVADRADPIRAGRVIDARGIGDPIRQRHRRRRHDPHLPAVHAAHGRPVAAAWPAPGRGHRRRRRRKVCCRVAAGSGPVTVHGRHRPRPDRPDRLVHR
jgi:hypothetical protein